MLLRPTHISSGGQWDKQGNKQFLIEPWVHQNWVHKTKAAAVKSFNLCDSNLCYVLFVFLCVLSLINSWQKSDPVPALRVIWLFRQTHGCPPPSIPSLRGIPDFRTFQLVFLAKIQQYSIILISGSKIFRYSLPTVISSWEVHNFKVMFSKFKIPLIVQMSRWNKCTKMSVMIWKMKCDPEMNSLNGSRWWYVTPIGKTNPPPGIGLQSSRATKSGTCLIESRLEAIRSELIIHRGRPLKCSGGRLQTSSRLLEKTSVDAVCFYSPLRILPSHGVCAVQLPKISWKSGACGTILFLHAAPYQLLEYQTCKEWGRLTFIL